LEEQLAKKTHGPTLEKNEHHIGRGENNRDRRANLEGGQIDMGTRGESGQKPLRKKRGKL